MNTERPSMMAYPAPRRTLVAFLVTAKAISLRWSSFRGRAVRRKCPMTLTGFWGAFVLVLLAPSAQPCFALRAWRKDLRTMKYAPCRRTRLGIDQTSRKAGQIPASHTSSRTRQGPYQPRHGVIAQQFDGCARSEEHTS